MISSTANKQVKYVNALIKKAKMRREENLFVAEGLRMCEELPKDRIRTLYVSESFWKGKHFPRLAEGVGQVEVAADTVFGALSDTCTPQGVLALAEQDHYTLEDIAMQPLLPHLMILEQVQDPGNLGTILRAGEGAGVTGIVMDEGTVDVYSPKVVRATMGSVLRVPFVYVKDLGDALVLLKKKGIRLYAACLEGSRDYDREDYTGSTGFLIGNEANGLRQETIETADVRIRIPMAGRVESLNAAMAAGVLMFEAARQRRRMGSETDFVRLPCQAACRKIQNRRNRDGLVDDCSAVRILCKGSLRFCQYPGVFYDFKLWQQQLDDYAGRAAAGLSYESDYCLEGEKIRPMEPVHPFDCADAGRQYSGTFPFEKYGFRKGEDIFRLCDRADRHRNAGAGIFS